MSTYLKMDKVKEREDWGAQSEKRLPEEDKQ